MYYAVVQHDNEMCILYMWENNMLFALPTTTDSWQSLDIEFHIWYICSVPKLFTGKTKCFFVDDNNSQYPFIKVPR